MQSGIATSLPAVERSATRQLRVTLAIIAAFLIAVISRLSFLGHPFQNDAGIYVYMGKVVWQGGRLYQDFWETKLPGVALLTAPLYAIFTNHWWPYVVTQSVLGIAAAWMLAFAARRFVSAASYVPTLLFGLIAFNLSRLNMTGFQLETIQLFFETVAACFVLSALKSPGLVSIFIAGLFAGLAALAKPTGLAVAGAAAVALLLSVSRDGIAVNIRRFAVLVVGAVLPSAGVAAWVLAMPWKTEMPEVFRQIGFYSSGTPWQSFLQFKSLVFFVLPFLPLIICGLFEMGKRATKSASDEIYSPLKPIWWFATAWAVLEIISVGLQRRLYGYHFLILMPPAALLFALIASEGRFWRDIIAILPLAILSLIFAAPGYIAMRHSQYSTVCRYVADHTDRGDSVWADPEARLLLEADRPAGSRLQMTFYLVNYNGAPNHFAHILLSDFETRKPKYIVLPASWPSQMQAVADDSPGLIYNHNRKIAYIAAWHEIDGYIKTNYHLETTLAGSEIYRRY